jgi:hypothetical protein
MPRTRGAPILELPFAAWPAIDQEFWGRAFRAGDDAFDACGSAAHLAAATRRSLRSSYGIFLGYLSNHGPDLLTQDPALRLDRSLLEKYIAWRRTTCRDAALANDLHLLRRALGYLCPSADWSWLLPIARRIAARAQPKPPRFHLVISDELYALGIELMDRADVLCIRKADAFQYRDGLIIALLAVLPQPDGSNRSKYVLFNHLVGCHEKGLRNLEAERPCGFKIDDKLKFVWLLHWKLGRLGAFQNAIDIEGRLAKLVV